MITLAPFETLGEHATRAASEPYNEGHKELVRKERCGMDGYKREVTVNEAMSAFYILEKLKELANRVEYMHNFQKERSDIVEYVYATHEIMVILKGGAE